MSTSFKKRIDRIKNKVNPPRYKKLEDIISELEMEANIESLSNDEKQYFELLKSLPVDPQLEAILKD